MTDQTPASTQLKWEPIPEGINLSFEVGGYTHYLKLPMTDVTELMHDMTEAYMLSRGFEKEETFPDQANYLDEIFIGDQRKIIRSVLQENHGRTCLQFDDGEELIVNSDQFFTFWRQVQ